MSEGNLIHFFEAVNTDQGNENPAMKNTVEFGTYYLGRRGKAAKKRFL